MRVYHWDMETTATTTHTVRIGEAVSGACLTHVAREDGTKMCSKTYALANVRTIDAADLDAEVRVYNRCKKCFSTIAVA